MLVMVVMGIWLSLVVVFVTVDVVSRYFEERPKKDPKSKDEKGPWKADRSEREIKEGITAYRNFKKIELGLAIVCDRDASVVRPRGMHRRIQTH